MSKIQKLKEFAENFLDEARRYGGYLIVGFLGGGRYEEFYPSSYEIFCEDREKIVFHGWWNLDSCWDIISEVEEELGIKVDLEDLPDELRLIEGEYVVYYDVEREKVMDDFGWTDEEVEERVKNEIIQFFKQKKEG